jgi:hypothetical protein
VLRVCVNVVFSVKVRGKVSLMWTGTKCVKGDRNVLYICGVQIVWCVCCNVLFSVTVRGTVSLMWSGIESVKGTGYFS